MEKTKLILNTLRILSHTLSRKANKYFKSRNNRAMNHALFSDGVEAGWAFTF